MSTVTSHPPPSERPQAHVVGFNQRMSYDPFLPSSPSDENLIRVSTHLLSPSAPTDRSPLSAEDLETGSPRPLASSEDVTPNLRSPTGQQFVQNHDSVNGLGTTLRSISPQPNDIVDSCNLMHPSQNYTLETNNFSEYDTSLFPEGFTLDAELDSFPTFEDEPEQESPNAPNSDSAYGTVRANPTEFYDLNQYPEKPSGFATHNSHLMSPVLTETASPGSKDDFSSPTSRVRALGGGTMSRMSSQSTTSGPLRSDHLFTQMQQTPALTGSSVEASPEPANANHIARASSPVVRVESYSRGDSPARVEESTTRKSKRSRASRSSSHLAAPDDESSSEDSNTELTVFPESSGAVSTRLRNDRAGLDPTARNSMADEFVPNFKDQETDTQIAQKNADVRDWLVNNSANANATNPHKSREFVKRRRAKSVGDQRLNALGLETVGSISQHLATPGPGLLIDEVSDEEDDEGDSFSSRSDLPFDNVDVDVENDDHDGYFPSIKEDLTESQFDAHPWRDPFYLPSQPGFKAQPDSSNAAIMQFQKLTNELETASRVATWGTRRMSEADLAKIIGPGGLLHRLSFGKDKNREKRDRRGSFLEQAAAKLLPKRSNSNSRRKGSETSKPANPQLTSWDHGRKESSASRKESPTGGASPWQMQNVSKQFKSPKLNTSGAVAAMASQIAAVGGSGSVNASVTSSPVGPWPSAMNVIKRRDRSEFLQHSSATEPGLAELWNQQGGPPIPTLASPPTEKPGVTSPRPAPGAEDEDDADELGDEKGISMDFSPQNGLIIPNFEGFKSQVRELNPRLAPFMVDRIGHEQLRRYKKLIELKVKHAQCKQVGKCKSGKHCSALGGEPTYLPSKAGNKEPNVTPSSFAIPALGASDDDTATIAEGIVNAAQFPPGVPLPPVKRLPAEFECPLCFTVRKFHKPSDWSKHVHEDVQPFTCTFPNCPEPKSFKRKADWVRHENERHRQLEWWVCNKHDCSHKCFRKDNFVQHLVREHKLPEPKVKVLRSDKPAVRGPASHKARSSKDLGDDQSQNDAERVWALVNKCHHTTDKNPKGESCRFCGNVCSSWKKLTVHLAKHMEQISMPVLNLVEKRAVEPDTVISPIEQRTPQHVSVSPTTQTPISGVGSASMQQYDIPVSMSGSQGELPGSFVALQPATAFHHNPNSGIISSSYQSDHQTSRAAQSQPGNTGTAYDLAPSNVYPMNSFQAYNNTGGPHFVMGNQEGYLQSFIGPHTENLYGGNVDGAMMQPASSPAYREYVYRDVTEQQAPFPSTMDASQYVYRHSLPTSFPLQHSATATAPGHYQGMASVQYADMSDESSLYNGQRRQQQS
ncbi:hypothetical protein MMC20_005684 [Loxospora ochrophaea]|nr:hypothetical protein [Loxospora ochrophaea]